MKKILSYILIIIMSCSFISGTELSSVEAATTESGMTDSVGVQVKLEKEIKEGTEETSTVGGGNSLQYTFIPETDGRYAFHVETRGGFVRVWACIYDKDYNIIAKSDGADMYSDTLYADMYAGEYYYLYYSGISGHVHTEGLATVKRVSDIFYVGEGVDYFDENWIEINDATQEKISTIEIEEEKKVGIVSEGAKSIYKFIPVKDGEYKFYTYGEPTTVVNVSDRDFRSKKYGIDSVVVEMRAYEIYFLTSYISGEYKNQQDTYAVQIIKLPRAESLSITNGDKIAGNVGDQETLNVGYVPEECESEELEWVSSDESVVEVEDGMIFMKSIGNATVTVISENGLSDSIDIEVTQYPEIIVDENMTLPDDEQTVIYTFIPEKSGIYTFFANADDEEKSMIIYLTDEENNPYVTKAGKESVSVTFEFYKGNVYYLKVNAEEKETLKGWNAGIITENLYEYYNRGDINKNGNVNAEDALLVLKHAARLENLDEIEMLLAEVVGDSTIDAKDALSILQEAARLHNDESSIFPVE